MSLHPLDLEAVVKRVTGSHAGPFQIEDVHRFRMHPTENYLDVVSFFTFPPWR